MALSWAVEEGKLESLGKAESQPVLPGCHIAALQPDVSKSSHLPERFPPWVCLSQGTSHTEYKRPALAEKAASSVINKCGRHENLYSCWPL